MLTSEGRDHAQIIGDHRVSRKRCFRLVSSTVAADFCPFFVTIDDGCSFEAIAAEAGSCKRRVQQVIDLAFLAPDIVRDITNGSQPMGLTSDS